MPENARQSVVIIGGGPAGLMAAEIISQTGIAVDLYDAMPSAGRKFLMAGKSGLNITHDEKLDDFLAHFTDRSPALETALKDFTPSQVRTWVHDLGLSTFVGSSGMVFPTDMKAAPLLRAWLHRLRQAGVRFHMRHRWLGWNTDGALCLQAPEAQIQLTPSATVLALGGGSWQRLGSDAKWIPLLQQHAVDIAPLKPANCGFDIHWSEHIRTQYAGQPVKSVVMSFTDPQGITHQRQGDLVITRNGIGGSLVYAFSRQLREEISRSGSARIYLDLAPARSPEKLQADLSRPRGSRSMARHLRARANIDGIKAVLLREVAQEHFTDTDQLARMIKALPLTLSATRPIDEAISTAGGVMFEAMDENLMLRAIPGTFCAGEMLDWEAPTGGYLLTACFASGRAAGRGVVNWLNQQLTQVSSPEE